jgi:hypothetical protein
MEKIEIYLCIGVEVNKLNAIKFRFLILFEIYSTDINSLLSYSIDLSNSLISFFFLPDLNIHSITLNKRLAKYEIYGASSLFVLSQATLISFVAVPMLKKLIGTSTDVWELPFKAA